MSLLRRGYAQKAAGLLAAGCWPPTKVTEACTIYGDSTAVAVDNWRGAQSSIAACLSATQAWRATDVARRFPLLLRTRFFVN